MNKRLEKWLGEREWRVVLAAVVIVVGGMVALCLLLGATTPFRDTLLP